MKCNLNEQLINPDEEEETDRRFKTKHKKKLEFSVGVMRFGKSWLVVFAVLSQINIGNKSFQIAAVDRNQFLCFKSSEKLQSQIYMFDFKKTQKGLIPEIRVSFVYLYFFSPF